MAWTESRVATLKRMWAEGFSASEIAEELGDTTRNAVIGVVHRAKLQRRGQQNTLAAAARKARKAKPVKVPLPPAVSRPVPPAITRMYDGGKPLKQKPVKVDTRSAATKAADALLCAARAAEARRAGWRATRL